MMREPSWFVQQSHYHFLVVPDPSSDQWQATEEHQRQIAPDYALHLSALGGTFRESENTWLFSPTTFPTEAALQNALSQAVRDADQERERLAQLLESGQLDIFETKVLPSASSPGQWIVVIHTTIEGISIPLRLPKAEQYDEVIPSFATLQGAQAFAERIKRTYSSPMPN